MKHLLIDCCDRCPCMKQISEGYNRPWICSHPEFKGGITDKRRNNNPLGKLKDDGSKPKTSHYRVTAGCPLLTI